MDTIDKLCELYNRKIIGNPQWNAIRMALRGEERKGFAEIISRVYDVFDKMPKTYGQESTADPVCHLHYFCGGFDWYITEKDCEGEQLQAFGLASMPPNYPELGYINLVELTQAGVELDLHFEPTVLSKIRRKLNGR